VRCLPWRRLRLDKAGVGQVPVNPWTSFAAGPGGVPLGPPPVSRPFP